MIADEKMQMITDGLYKDLTYKVIGAVYEVHKDLSSVHKEIIYHKALAIELKNKNISFSEEKSIDVKYKGKRIGVYKPDFVIDDKVILEIKIAPAITKAMQDQVYYYVKGTKYNIVLLVNFGTSRVGIKRLIYTHNL
ncbi:MAG: GxxExxY protein [Candidatus Omnitrophica bacterium]|nr:GxxExxY protein [Candidatus Omnitrophota bacterium]